MSISLGTAFWLDVKDLNEAWRLLSEFRGSLQNIGRKANAELYAKHATILIDQDATLSLREGEISPAKGSPLSVAASAIKERRKDISRTGYRDPEVDFDFTVTLCPAEGTFYGLVHSEQDAWTDLLLNIDKVHHAPWWDNVDRPNDISQQDWDKRGDLWKQIFARDPAMRPSHCGMTFEMTPYHGSPLIEEVVDAQEAYDKRLSRIARTCLTHASLRAAGATETSHIMRVLWEVDDLLRSGDGADELADYKSACDKMMKKSLERGDFQGLRLSVEDRLPPHT
jgi:hypothetical protein